MATATPEAPATQGTPEDAATPQVDVNKLYAALMTQNDRLFILAQQIQAQETHQYVPDDLPVEARQELINGFFVVRAQATQQVLSALQRIQCMIYGIGIQLTAEAISDISQQIAQIDADHQEQLDGIQRKAEEVLPKQPSTGGAETGAS